jgi:hypothetical protein
MSAIMICASGFLNQDRPYVIALVGQFYSLKVPTVVDTICLYGNIMLAAKRVARTKPISKKRKQMPCRKRNPKKRAAMSR